MQRRRINPTNFILGVATTRQMLSRDYGTRKVGNRCVKVLRYALGIGFIWSESRCNLKLDAKGVDSRVTFVT